MYHHTGRRAEFTALDNTANCRMRRMITTHQADGEFDPVFRSGGDHRIAIGQRWCHRFLGEDVLASIRSINRHRRVHKRR